MGQTWHGPRGLQRLRHLYRRNELDWPHSIILALVCVGLATGGRILLGLIGPTLAFATFFPAVMVSTLIGGRRPGLLATALSIVVVWWAFKKPYYSFGPLNKVVLANFVVFSVSCLAIIWLALAHRQLVFDLEDKEQERQILAEEILHRSKNLVAVIGSLIHQTVSNKEEAVALLSRMRVVAGSDDLLQGAKPGGLRELLEVCVREPHGQQIVLDGKEIHLNADQTRSLALVFHEMTTNAVKYGALSRREGRVIVEWVHADDVLTIVWTELDGPTVSPPAKLNFGSKLIASMLKQIDAELNTTFAATGYRYEIHVPMSLRS